MYEKDLKMFCKDGDDWSPNRMDFFLNGKVIETVDSTERIVQAIKKMVLSPLQPYGYGIDIAFLRGKKSFIRESIIKTRILRSLKIIEKMYDQSITPITMDINQIKDKLYIHFEVMFEQFNINI